MPDFLTIDALSKNYANGFEALKTINLRVEEALSRLDADNLEVK